MSGATRLGQCFLLLAFGLLSQVSLAAMAGQQPKPDIEDLGGGRVRVGAIEVDKEAGRFQVAGQVIQLDNPDSPIEFLAVPKGGVKSYESLFELDTSAVEFNLACILIGLDAERATLPEVHFDPAKLEGDGVNIAIGWQHEGREQRLTGGELFGGSGDAAVADDWVYTGSRFSPEGYYMAHESGTLVGFVHDTDSVIQHRSGVGLGDYGAVSARSLRAPPPGTPVIFYVERQRTP